MRDKILHEAAEAHYCGNAPIKLHSPQYGPMVNGAAVLDVFKAGALWQRDRQNSADQAEDIETGRYRAIMDKLDHINKMTGEVAINNESMHKNLFKTVDNLASDQASRHKMTTGALVETQNMVSHVLCHVCPKEDERDNLDRLNDELSKDALAEHMYGALAPSVDKSSPVPTRPDLDRHVAAGGALIGGVDLAKPGSDRTGISVTSRAGTRPINIPEEAGPVVDMVQFGNRVFVACAFGVFYIDGHDLKPLRFSA